MKKNEIKDGVIVNYNEINDDQMNGLLIELYQTSYWQAVLKKIYARDAFLVGGLAVVDAFKEPNRIAKMQGERDGLYYLEEEIKKEVERRKKIEEGGNPNEDINIPKYT